MSAPAKTTDGEIRRVARQLLELHGVDGVTMAAVAEAVGVRAPSLYKRFASKPDLLRAVTRAALGELAARMEQAARPDDARGSLERMAEDYRAFARANPRVYELIFTPAEGEDLEARKASVVPLFAVLGAAIGQERALPAARLLVAYLHGYVTMELQGLFQLGGNIDEGFSFGLMTILDGLLGGLSRESPGASLPG